MKLTKKKKKKKKTDQNKTKRNEKSRKIVFPKLVTSGYFQKGLNPPIVENKEMHRNLYKSKQTNKQTNKNKQTKIKQKKIAISQNFGKWI